MLNQDVQKLKFHKNLTQLKKCVKSVGYFKVPNNVFMLSYV